MSKFWFTLLMGLFLVTGFKLTLAETREKPYNEEQLFEKSTIVFVGEVLKTRMLKEYKRSVPTKARVLLNVKGKAERDERRIAPKDPSRFEYCDAEVSPALAKEMGVFYVKLNDDENVLIAYRRIEPK
jgi:hypothetical protein